MFQGYAMASNFESYNQRDTLICLRPRKLVKKKVNCLIKESVTNGAGETGGDSSEPETESRFVRHQTEDALKALRERCAYGILNNGYTKIF